MLVYLILISDARYHEPKILFHCQTVILAASLFGICCASFWFGGGLNCLLEKIANSS